MSARTESRARPEPAGEPAPTTIDPPATPVEDVPEHATPAPEPRPERSLDELRRAFDEGGPDNLTEDEHRRLFEADDLARVAAPAPAPVFGRRDLTGDEQAVVEQIRSGALGLPFLLRDLTPEQLRDEALDLLSEAGLAAEPHRDGGPLSASEALAEVMRRVRPIAKGRQADARVGGYSFRGIDDVYAALHDLFAEVGLVCLPSTIEREREQRPRLSGEGANYVTHVRVRLRFLAQDGTSEELDAWGEGADTGDKSTGKAYSQAMKSALLAAFLIPTEASSQDDPDVTNSASSRPWTAEEQQRAGTALDAGRQASTFDALVGVRRRAEAGDLLDVPLIGEGGSIAPLRLHLDNLRAQLERQVRS